MLMRPTHISSFQLGSNSLNIYLYESCLRCVDKLFGQRFCQDTPTVHSDKVDNKAGRFMAYFFQKERLGEDQTLEEGFSKEWPRGRVHRQHSWKQSNNDWLIELNYNVCTIGFGTHASIGITYIRTNARFCVHAYVLVCLCVRCVCV